MNKRNQEIYQTSPINFSNTCRYMNKIEKSTVYIEIIPVLVNVHFQYFCESDRFAKCVFMNHLKMTNIC